MPPFEFFSAPRIVFGRGTFARLPELAVGLGGSSALVVSNGAGEPGGGGLTDRLTDALTAAKLNARFLRQRGEPTVADVDRGAEVSRQYGCDLVIGLGGGSAIDAAKAVAGLLTNGGSALDYMEVVGKGQKLTRPAAPWVAVPTTAGTGAEVTRNAVIGYPEKQFKASLRSELLLPRVALVDPALGVTVPPDVTARCGMDALCQCVEAYTSTGANPMTDALALKGMTLAARSLRPAVRDGTDLAAREDMAMAALLSGVCLTNAGLGAVHGFAAPLGANFPVPHGTVCADLLPPVIAANVKALRERSPNHPALARYAEVGRALTGADGSDPGAAAAFTSDLVRELNIPPLREFGISEAAIPAMVALARKASSMRYNPVVLSDEELAAVLRQGIAGAGGM